MEPEKKELLKNYKWIVSSALQKSIRRGRADLAQSYVSFLWNIDRSYLCYRLGTILCEDIGVANLDLVSEYLQTKGAKKEIDSRGGEDFIQKIVASACDSIKDRSSCDSAYLTGFLPLYLSVNDKESVEHIYKESNNYKDKIQAIWLILGNKKFKNDNWSFFDEYLLDAKGVKQDDVARATELFANDYMRVIFKNAYDTQRENISLGMPVMYEAMKSEKLNDSNVGRIVEKKLLPEFTVHDDVTGLNILNVAIDGHTSEGKSIYYSLLNNREFKNVMQEFNVAEEDRINILKHLIFRLEGHEVNKRIYYPTAVKVMKDCEQIPLNYKANCFDESFSFEILREVGLNLIDILNQRRSDVFSNKTKNTFKKGF